MNKLRVPLLVVVLMLVGVVLADDEKKAEKVDPQTQQLRDEFGLARIMFLKQAAEDAEISSSIRDALVKICDSTRDDMLAAVDQEKNQPGDDEDRKQAIKDLGDKFAGDAFNITKSDPKADQSVGRQIKRLTYELELIRKGELVAQMGDLDLTEEQKSAIEEVVANAKKKVKAKSMDDAMKDEQSMTRLLDARKKISEKLHDDQKDQWKAYVNSHASEKRTPGGLKVSP